MTTNIDLTKFNQKGKPRQRKQKSLQHYIYKVMEFSKFGGYLISIRLYSDMTDMSKDTGVSPNTIRYVIRNGGFNPRGKFAEYDGVIKFERVRVPMYGVKKIGFVDVENTIHPAIMSSPELFYNQISNGVAKLNISTGYALKT